MELVATNAVYGLPSPPPPAVLAMSRPRHLWVWRSCRGRHWRSSPSAAASWRRGGTPAGGDMAAEARGAAVVDGARDAAAWGGEERGPDRSSSTKLMGQLHPSTRVMAADYCPWWLKVRTHLNQHLESPAHPLDGRVTDLVVIISK
jgi:hypothetical protein